MVIDIAYEQVEHQASPKLLHIGHRIRAPGANGVSNFNVGTFLIAGGLQQ
jgi:hypothetical protein